MAVATSNRVIAVFGAYGHTARFVVSELRARGWVPVLSGRDATKLVAVGAGFDPVLETHLASVEDPASLDRAIAGAAAVINCAGPFGATAPAVIDAALRAGIHYLDVNGQSLVTIRIFERYANDARVQNAGIVIAPAVGFYGALGDLLATVAMGRWLSADEISIAVALDGWKPTRGTLLAGEDTAGRRVVLSGHRLQILSGNEPPPSGTWDFPAPFGTQVVVGQFSTTDVVTIARHLDVADIHAFINRAPLADLDEPDSPGPQPADESGRSAQTFVVDVVARRADERRRVVAGGRDIYAFTAPIVVEAVERILDGRCTAGGVVAAGEIFNAEDFLRALPFEHLSLKAS